ncbi:uncharacterized protein N7473_013253 [Penicillium subrubescens]|uniref:uncharacterized protein n=1 Tax=Penicillium subrubescens TaxID=1316194 RepID=UPI0025458BC7|nr:uncharacterized protein N7473_013253 [Penicillium subrubescens]KAJ5873380.1 hypothetical protein N7473_013253 [Penicillium subrubescens]
MDMSEVDSRSDSTVVQEQAAPTSSSANLRAESQMRPKATGLLPLSRRRLFLHLFLRKEETRAHERNTVEDFFNLIHHSIPLFRKDRFVEQYRNGTINPCVLVTVLVVTAKLLGPAEIAQAPDIESCLQVLLRDDPFEGVSQPNIILDAFRQSCLLAYYRFHQFHGEDAWDYVGQLARKALRLGLHQLDSFDGYNLFGDGGDDLAGVADLEEWRYVWWCIYCLDSYSNITAATPFVLEMDGIRTALVSTSLEDQGQDPAEPRVMDFLPTNTKDLWHMSAVMGIMRTPASYFNMHIVTTTILRQAATIRRLRRQNLCEILQERHRQFEDHLSAVLLSLPPAFLSETRNVLANEPSLSHHARLVCLLHLYSARLLNVITVHTLDDAAWASSWQRSLVYSEDIVAVVRHWDSRYCSTVDPAICLIVFSVLVLLYMHEIHEATAALFTLRHRLEAERNLLILFLQQFSQTWALPRLLRESFDNFTNMVKGPLTSHDIGLLFTQVPGPFQPWRGLFGLAPSPPDPLRIPHSPMIEIAGLRFSSDFFSFL